MAKAARGGRWWRPGRVLGPAALAFSVLGACGGSSPSAPTAPGPTPTTPAPVSAGFLHVLQGDSVVTYRIDAATGQLRQSATQTVGDAHTLTGEPQGRYVFAAFGPRGGPPYFDPSIVAYAPDPSSGSLRTVSEASSDPIWCRGCSPVGRGGRWYWLAASATRVYGMWGTTTYHDWYPAYVTHALEKDGQLGPAYARDFGEWDDGVVTVDVDSDVFYKQGSTGLTAHFVEPDGSLTQVGASHLCRDSTLSDPRLLVAVRGFLFASEHRYTGGQYEYTVCSWEGPRLAPRANFELQSDYAAALAPREVSGASSSSAAMRRATLVAMRTSYSVKRGTYYDTINEVRLFAMSDNGDLELLDTVEAGYAWQLLFHPSGRFLYLSHAASYAAAPDSLTVYAIDTQGHLAVVETLEGAGGAMAVTLR